MSVCIFFCFLRILGVHFCLSDPQEPLDHFDVSASCGSVERGGSTLGLRTVHIEPELPQQQLGHLQAVVLGSRTEKEDVIGARKRMVEIPDRTFHNFWAFKSVGTRFFYSTNVGRRICDSEIVSGSVGIATGPNGLPWYRRDGGSNSMKCIRTMN